MMQEESRMRDVYAKRRDEKEGLYSLWNKWYLLFIQDLERELIRFLSKQGLNSLQGKAILEVGCGSGYWIRKFLELGATPESLVGIDLLDWRIDVARRICPGSVRLERGNAERLEFSDRSFDMIAQFVVFSSILDANVKRRIASEMLRVLKEDGFIIWYDFFLDNPRNRDVKGLNKSEIRRLFPGCRIQLRRITLAPPLARLMAPYSWVSCHLLEKLKVFNTHYLGIIRKDALPI
jgi:ubiquinone/menaquinone biosynthesis C-methylase UbiE